MDEKEVVSGAGLVEITSATGGNQGKSDANRGDGRRKQGCWRRKSQRKLFEEENISHLKVISLASIQGSEILVTSELVETTPAVISQVSLVENVCLRPVKVIGACKGSQSGSDTNKSGASGSDRCCQPKSQWKSLAEQSSSHLGGKEVVFNKDLVCDCEERVCDSEQTQISENLLEENNNVENGQKMCCLIEMSKFIGENHKVQIEEDLQLLILLSLDK